MDVITLQLEKIICDTWRECTWAESIEECNAIIEAGRRKVAAIDLLQKLKSLVSTVTKSQQVLAKYIEPDSGIGDVQCLNELLGILDHKDLVAMLNELTAVQVSDTTMPNNEPMPGQ